MQPREAAEQAVLRFAIERGFLSEPAAHAARAELARLRAAGAARELLSLLRERLPAPAVRELEGAYLRALGAAAPAARSPQAERPGGAPASDRLRAAPVADRYGAAPGTDRYGAPAGGPGGDAPDLTVERPLAPPSPAPADVTIDRPLAPAARTWVPAARPRRLGPYELGEELARGGMGAVFVARHVALGRKVAVKVVLGADAHALQRFGVEARAAARLRHPNIVAVHEVGTDQGQSFIAMDLIEGESLGARIERAGPLAPEEAAQLVEKLARALHAAHEQGVLHRDLKPSNVMIDGAGEPLVTDFGLAKAVDEALSLTATGQMLGTPAYMPPEQVRGQKERIDARSDVYALGATLFEALTGEAPFGGDASMNVVVAVVRRPPPRPSALRPGLDPTLEAICLRCLEKEPEGRYPSAAALADALAAWRAGERAASAAPPPLPAPSLARRALPPLLSALAAFVAGALLPRGPDPAALERSWAEATRALTAALAAEQGPAGEGARAEGRAALERAAALAPDAAGPREGLAALELVAGREPDELVGASALAADGPRTPAGHYLAGRLAEAAGRASEALVAYRAARDGGCAARDLPLRLARAEASDADARGWRRTAEEARWRALASAPHDLAPLAELVDGWLAAGAVDALTDGWSALRLRLARREPLRRDAGAPAPEAVLLDPAAPLAARVAAALAAPRLPSDAAAAGLEAARGAEAPLLREAARASLLALGALAPPGTSDPLEGFPRWAAAAAGDAASGPAAALTLLELAPRLGEREAAALEALTRAPSPTLRAASALALAVSASRAGGLPAALASARLEPLRADPEPRVAAAAAAALGALGLLHDLDPEPPVAAGPPRAALRLAGGLLALPGADPALDEGRFESHVATRSDLGPDDQLAAAERMVARGDDAGAAAASHARAVAPSSADAAALEASLAVLRLAPDAAPEAGPLAVPGADPLALEEARVRLAFAAQYGLLALPAPHGRLRVIAPFGAAASPRAADGIDVFAEESAGPRGVEGPLALVTAFPFEGLRSIRLVATLASPLRIEAYAPRSLLAPAGVSLGVGGQPGAAEAPVARFDVAFGRASFAAWQDGALLRRAPLPGSLGPEEHVRLVQRAGGRLTRLELVGSWRGSALPALAPARLAAAPAHLAVVRTPASERPALTLGDLAAEGALLRACGGGGERLALPPVRGELVLRVRLRFRPERERAAGVTLRLAAEPGPELRVLLRERAASRATQVTVELVHGDQPPLLLGARAWSPDASWLVFELERRGDRLAVRVGPDPEHGVEVLEAPLYLPRSASPLEAALVASDPTDPPAPASARFDQLELRTVAIE